VYAYLLPLTQQGPHFPAGYIVYLYPDVRRQRSQVCHIIDYGRLRIEGIGIVPLYCGNTGRFYSGAAPDTGIKYRQFLGIIRFVALVIQSRYPVKIIQAGNYIAVQIYRAVRLGYEVKYTGLETGNRIPVEQVIAEVGLGIESPGQVCGIGYYLSGKAVGNRWRKVLINVRFTQETAIDAYIRSRPIDI
jgi:hypothetical protein